MEGLEGVKDEISHVFIHVGIKDPPIKVVNCTPTIHDFTNQVLQTVPWNLGITKIKRLGQVRLQNLLTD